VFTSELPVCHNRIPDTKIAQNSARVSGNPPISNHSASDDTLLVERCLRGDVAAWEELYCKCHDPLCAAIRYQLGRTGADSQLVDEMAARVWYRLVDQNGKQLKKFNPARGAILTFIRLIARKEISNYFRADKRRLKNDLSSIPQRYRLEVADRNEVLPIMLTEFLDLLTPSERDFCCGYLRVSAENDPAVSVNRYTSTNIWQLTHRIYMKLQNYLGSIS
jgi:DNA-directed RNA polymerase specialized sigma24 family protein